MYDLNSVTLSGNLVSDPEYKELRDDLCVCNFRMASNRGENTVYVDVECWRGLAKIVNDFCSKGQKVVVLGDLKQEQWTDSDGNNRSKILISARDLTIVERKNS